MIRPLDARDLAQVAQIHMSAFPDGAITAFGDDFVVEYYRWLLESQPNARLVGAFDGAQLRGFCAAGQFKDALSGFLRKHRLEILGRLLRTPRLLASPLIRDRIKQGLAVTVKFSRFARARGTTAPQTPGFGVLAIATAPEARGSGAGRALMHEAERRARAAGAERMGLTVHPTNTRAVRFYEGLGWERSAEGKSWQGRMYKRLHAEGERT